MDTIASVFNAAMASALGLRLRGMTEATNNSVASREVAFRRPGKRSFLNVRPSHPGKPEAYYRQASVPGGRRRSMERRATNDEAMRQAYSAMPA